jgi:hypothetical protein
MKKILTYISLITAANLLAANLVWAETPTSTLIEVQEMTQNLINTQDQETATSTPEKTEIDLRLEVFWKVLELSIKESEDIINQLNALKDLTEQENNLRSRLLDKFNGFLDFYKGQKENLSQFENIDLTAVKKIAQDFKDWRENDYLSVFETATDFLLINQQKTVLTMTENRYQKISFDIAKLKKTNLKGIDQLEKYLNQAADSIKSAETAWQEAKNNFWQLTTATSTATSSSATAAENQSLSIKDLIGESLNKIKDTYQIFIEMSNLVRKLLL